MANDCKYNRLETVVSYDGGVSWESQTPPVYHRGTLIEPHSQDCETGSTLERWIVIEGDYLCDDNNRKYKKEMLENSYDGGVTWYPSNPTTFRLGQFVSVDVDFCSYSSESHYIIPDKSEGESCAEELSCRTMYMPTVVNGICTCVYVDPIKVIKCSTDTLTENNLSNGNYGLQTLKVGECTRVIDINENSSFANIFMRPYLTTIDTSKAVNLQIIDDGSFSFCDGIYRVAGQRFRKGDGLQSIVIPSGVTSIGDFAFYSCSAMTSVTIDNAQCTIGGQAFAYCDSLNTLDLGSGVTSIGNYAFNGCSSLRTNLTIPSSVTYIGNMAFYRCPLVSVTCLATTPPTFYDEYDEPFGEYDSGYPIYVPCSALYTYLEATGWSRYSRRIKPIPPCEVTPKYVFTLTRGSVVSAVCDSTSSITTNDTSSYKRTMTSVEIGSCVSSIDNEAFRKFSGLTSCTIGSGVTSIGTAAFQGCRSLTSCTLGSGVTSIGQEAFQGCRSLTSCTIGSGVTRIGEKAFRECAFGSIIIPSGITNIGNQAFYSCTRLTSVTCLATTPPTLGTEAFDYNASGRKIYVPSESVAAYQAAWIYYSQSIEAIP